MFKEIIGLLNNKDIGKLFIANQKFLREQVTLKKKPGDGKKLNIFIEQFNNIVQNIIKLSERENRIVNVVKAKYGMKNKNQSLGFIIQTYAKQFLPEMLQPIEKPGRTTEKHVESVQELRKEIRE
jgi:hypothetical protein